jgi:hypothetical protein
LTTPIGQPKDSRLRGIESQATPLTSTPTIGSTRNGDRRPFEWRTAENAYTREYSYTVQPGQPGSNSTAAGNKLAGAFSYAPNGSNKSAEPSPVVVPKSELDGGVGSEPKRATARAFTYKPPEASTRPVTGKPPTPVKMLSSGAGGKESPSTAAKENRSPVFTSGQTNSSENQVEQVKSSRSETRQFAQLIQTGKEQRQEQQLKRETKSIDKMNALFGSSKSKKSESESKTASIFSSFGRRSETPTSGGQDRRKSIDANMPSMKQSLESDSDTDSQKSSENSMDEYATEELNSAPNRSFGSNDRLKMTKPIILTAPTSRASPTVPASSGGSNYQRSSTNAGNKSSATGASMTNSQSTRSFDSSTTQQTLPTGSATQNSRVREAVMQKERTVSKQVTESSKTFTGKLEDIYPIIKNEAIKFGHPADQELPLPSKSVPVVTSETRKSQYSSSSGSWQQNVTEKSNAAPIKTYGSTLGGSAFANGPRSASTSYTSQRPPNSPKPQTAPKPSLDAIKRAGSPSVFGAVPTKPSQSSQPEARDSTPTSPTSPVEASKAAKRRFLNSGSAPIPNVTNVSEKISESSVSNKTKTVETVTVSQFVCTND